MAAIEPVRHGVTFGITGRYYASLLKSEGLWKSISPKQSRGIASPSLLNRFVGIVIIISTSSL